MAEVGTIEANVRTRQGTGGARAVRREGQLPGIIYGGGKDPVSISIDPRQIEKDVNSSVFFAKLYDMKIDGKKERVIPRDLQVHIINERPTHVDFMRVSKDDLLTISIPLRFLNEEMSPGLKRGGVLNAVLHELELICPADQNIPDHIDIDLTGLEMHHTIHVSNLELPAGVKSAHPDRDETIATIVAPSSVRSEAAEAAAELAAIEGAEAEGEAGGEAESK